MFHVEQHAQAKALIHQRLKVPFDISGTELAHLGRFSILRYWRLNYPI